MAKREKGEEGRWKGRENGEEGKGEVKGGKEGRREWERGKEGLVEGKGENGRERGGEGTVVLDEKMSSSCLDAEQRENRKRRRRRNGTRPGCPKDGRATENAMSERGIQNDPHTARVWCTKKGMMGRGRKSLIMSRNRRERSRMPHCRAPFLLDADARTVAEESVTCMAVQEARHQHIISSRAVGVGNSCEIHQLFWIPSAHIEEPHTAHNPLTKPCRRGLQKHSKWNGARSDW